MMPLPKTPSFRLEGRRALVTGASSGIGQGCAVALAEAGAHVVLAARGLQRLDQTIQSMHEQGYSCEALALDIADVAAVQKAVSQQGPFDILVNSAGLARHAAALDTQLEDFDTVMNVNLRGAYFLTQAVAKGLIEAGKPGSLINISSQMAHVGGVDRSVYCASKFAVEGFTKAMAIEWGRAGIRVNTVCPTFIRTPLTEQTFDQPERVRWIEEKIKMGRTGVVEDIMGSVLYLASDAAALVTGTALMVDGGWTAD
ncbi:SDR family NAD(P)-dependent oxidoreductase [Granulosicoccus antarcticus]|uniref:2-dehydro-3-deoxy-D-gluconate 5-dehydrogenase n=1 Tax=Granulosicoccus antarcticus IMCC3135 TaxID=1192854 RepID=A0A2Z2NUP8_9GAMM|nr:SDR family oxidoreductase [Granulosicoccus antarcticus]ASJ74225.1 2-dehydro-3-deoxy-D-gluconate 5-dehydrogenase [Granulosicoccus antarcticus IMCC3135]